MSYRRAIILAFVTLLWVTQICAANESIGTTGFNFLRVTYSARAAGMANSFTGQADDIETLFFNPAGLPQLASTMVATSYLNYFEGFQGGSLLFAKPAAEGLSYGFYLQYLGNQSITRTIVDDSGEFIGTAGTFGANDLLIGVSGGVSIHEFLNLGASVKYIYESLDDYSASAAAVDLSLLHQTMNENLKVGITLRNIGRQVTYYTAAKYREKLPTQFTIGFNYQLPDRFNANLDIVKPFDHDFSGRIGFEYRVHPMFSLRAGFDSRADDWRMGGDYDILSGLSTGFGCYLKQYELNYGISSYGDLGLVNQISLKYNF
jgi:hypothetical protein